MATHFGDLLASQLSCKNRVFCINRVKSQTVFKNFSVFPHITCTDLSCLPLLLPKPPLSLTNPPFSSSIFKKGMGFLLFSMYFKFLALVFFDFVYMLRYGNMVVAYGFVDVLMSMIYGFCWYNAYSTCFTRLFFILMHCTMRCVVLSIPC